MTTVYQYRIYCNTESDWKYVWNTSPPTKCPDNTAHTVNTNSVSVTDKSSTSVVEIKEESVPTGGNFKTRTVKINAAANTTTGTELWWPFPVSALSMNFVTTSDHEGDIISVMVGKDTIIGALTADVSSGSAWTSQNYTAGDVVTYNAGLATFPYTCITNTVSNEVPNDTTYWTLGLRIPVSQTVIDNTAIGYYIKLYDGTNNDDIGRVLSVDTNNNYIYVETNLTNSFAASTPTYVQQTVYSMKDYEIGPAWDRELGQSKIGGSSVPKFVKVRVEYTNNDPVTAKTFVGHVEYLY